jgi:8-oxo-dGTP pyrophosphatase MutT (NUDIX family)
MKKVTRVGVYGVALQNESILLITKGDKHIPPDQLDLPGGGFEFGETSEEALRREFREEVGMTFKSMRLLDNLTSTTDILEANPPYTFHQIGQIYEVYGWEAIPGAVTEHAYAWYPLDSINTKLLTPFAEVFIQRLRRDARLLSF